MARIQTGPLISDIRGSIGGTTFQRTGSGLVAHNKMSVPNYSTNKQTDRRNLLSSLQQAWMSLLPAQRTAWQTWAEYQSIKVKTFSTSGAYGQQAFIQANFYAVMAGLPVLSDPVFSPYSMVIVGWRLALYMTGLYIDVDTTESHTDYVPCFKVSASQKPSLNTPRSQLVYCHGIWTTTYGWNIVADWKVSFGQTPTAGMTVFVEAGFMQVSNYTLSSFNKSSAVMENFS